jgi:hypothetical protein
MTIPGYEKLKKNMEVIQLTDHLSMNGYVELTDAAIIEVHEGTFTKPDNFLALVKGRDASQLTGLKNYGVHDFTEEWFFIRQGEWWLLDDIKVKKSFLKN